MDEDGRPERRQGELCERGDRRTEMELAHIPISAIRVVHNPRTTTDVEGIRELARSIASVGQIEPVAVVREDGGYVLVAGGRRLEALKELRRDEAACVILEEDGPYLRKARSISENMSRRAMSAVDEARAIADLSRELGLAIEEIAEVLGISVRTAYARLDLLKLPPEVRSHVNAERITLRGAAHLAAVAEKSPRLAGELGERIASGALERRAFDADPAAAVGELAGEEDSTAPFCLPFSQGTRLKVSETARRIVAAGGHSQLEEVPRNRVNHAREAPATELVEVSSTDALRARSWGGLLEYRRDRFGSTAYLTDARFAADWFVEALEQKLDLRERADADREEPDDKDLAAERERRQLEIGDAKATNELIGRKCQLELDYQKEVSLEQATVLGALLVDAYGRDMVHGLRLVRRDWRQRDAKEMASGATRVIERYPEPDEARELLERLLEKAETGPQLIGRLFSAVAASVGADQRALQPSARRELVLPYAPGRADTVVGRLPASLLSEIEGIVPEERYRELEASIGEEELPEVPDRRSKRQIESEERERARRDAASHGPAETDGLGSLAETLLGLGEGEGGSGSTPGPSEPAAQAPPSEEDRERVP